MRLDNALACSPTLQTPPTGMQIRCPQCRCSIELEKEVDFSCIHCANCGSSFSLIGDDETKSFHSPVLRTIGHFQISTSIGQGAFGTVWKARDVELDREVAIKLPRKERLDANQTESFLREARAAAQLRHPNVVQVHEVGRDGDTVYIVSELVQGITLSDWLTGQRPSCREAARLCVKVAGALHHAHEQGVIHRDLKPSNIMLDRDLEPHLLDFGLARRQANEITMTIDGQVLGTPAYMSPEQAQGESHRVDRRTDIYSLGVILFELLTGERPFRGNARMLLHQVLNEDAPSPRKLNAAIPRDLETVCLKCLCREPDRRYATAEELRSDLERWLEGMPIMARPASFLEKAWLWCRRRPAVALLLAAIALLLVASASWAKWRERQLAGEALVEQIISARIDNLPDLVARVPKHRVVAVPKLNALLWSGRDEDDPQRKLRIRLALAQDDATHVEVLRDQLLEVTAEEAPIAIAVLKPFQSQMTSRLWEAVETGTAKQRLRAAAALAAYAPEDDRWAKAATDVEAALILAPAGEWRTWVPLLRPVGRLLAGPLEGRFRDRDSQRQLERTVAAIALADYLREDRQKLRQLILLADDADQFQPLLAALRAHWRELASTFHEDISAVLSPDAHADAKTRHQKAQANAAVCLVESGEPEAVWPLLELTSDPSLRSLLIARLASLGANPRSLIARLKLKASPSLRQALVLALGDTDDRILTLQERQQVVGDLAKLYCGDDDPGVHSAVGWTLRQWKQESLVRSLDDELRASPPLKGHDWFINSEGQMMLVVNGPVQFAYGAQMGATNRSFVTLDHRFAIAACEITVANFRKFRPDHSGDPRISPQDDCPATRVTWFEAVAYCNWLSERDGIPPEQWCYLPNEKQEIGEGMHLPADCLRRSGYRLPTTKEWEYVARAGTTTSYSFGEPLELLDRYAWNSSNSRSRTWPVGRLRPNLLGAFDCHGNCWEWCHDLFNPRPPDADGGYVALDKDYHRDSRTLCGGAFYDGPWFVRSDSRVINMPRYLDAYEAAFSFRPARTLPVEPPE